MDWIKKHTDQFALALLALMLTGMSVLLLLKTEGFTEGFSDAMTSPPHSKEIPKLDTTIIEKAQKEFIEPTAWIPKAEVGSLFVSWKLVEENGALSRAEKGFLTDGRRKIPKEWPKKHDLDYLSVAVLDEDPDKDGFTNYDEYIGAELSEANEGKNATNPKDKESHPPYHTKLYLKQWIKIPFLLTFQSADGDPAKPAEMTFQINAISRGSKTEFLKLGDKVANSPFKLLKYEEKKRMNEKIGVEEDVSELTVTNTETNEPVILVLGKRTDSPDSYALFAYLWPDAAKPQEIKVKKLQEFLLKPNIEERYKLVDIKDDGAVITLPGSDKTYNVPLLSKALLLQKAP